MVVKGEESLSWPIPRYIFEFADKLIIQTIIPFKRRGLLLDQLFKELPSTFNEFKVKLLTSELPNDLVNHVVKREMKFSDLLIYNVTVEYSDNVDSMLKSTRALRVCRSTFRQIFPRKICNETENEI